MASDELILRCVAGSEVRGADVASDELILRFVAGS